MSGRGQATLEAAAADITTRILQGLDRLATFTAAGPGVTRLAYTAEDDKARHWFEAECCAAGLEFESDYVGNAFAWSPGSRRARPLLIGSHLDSVIEGGRFDGALGVVIGLEVARHVVREGNEHPIGVASFACEESTRFGFGVVGSRALMGVLGKADLHGLVDRDGKTLTQVLREKGMGDGEGDRIQLDDRFAGAFLEVHIDQGNILDEPDGEGYPVGLVTSIVGVSRVKLTFAGQAAHSGAHLRENRRDPLLAAAQLVLAVDALWEGTEAGGDDTLAVTVGKLDVYPNSPNTVAGRVELILDVRSSSERLLDSTVTTALRSAREIAGARELELSVETLYSGTPARVDPQLMEILEQSAQAASIPALRVPSLAGHDAMVLASGIPIAMLFVGNPAGISHAPDEGIDETSLRRAVQLILEALPALTGYATDG